MFDRSYSPEASGLLGVIHYLMRLSVIIALISFLILLSKELGSDIDLVIVSPDFEGMNIRQRLELSGLVSVRILEPIQAYGLTPEEVEKHQTNSFWKVLKKPIQPPKSPSSWGTLEIGGFFSSLFWSNILEYEAELILRYFQVFYHIMPV
jgi:hypothetical protein